MSAKSAMEQRLTAVEQAVVELQERLACVSPPPNWVERFTGAFKNEPAFDQVIEYGREIRASDQSARGTGQ